MPAATFFTFPNFSGTSEKSGSLTDDAGVKYPLVRFQDERVQVAATGISGTFANNSIVGTKITFTSMAAASGWGGAVTGAALHVNNTVLAADTLTLLLFNKDLTTTITSASLITALALTDAECESYIGAIALANPIQVSGKTLFSSNALNFKYVCDATSLFGILILNSTASRTLSSARITPTLQITKS
jgi:hypothetical protein